jgi:hypothetical protein
MELDCVLFEKPVQCMEVSKSGTYRITIKTSCGKVFYLTKEGYLYDMADSQCIIFPKGKTTWEGFVPPCKFKDGDVVAFKSVGSTQKFISLCIVDCIIGNVLYTKASCSYNGHFLCTCEEQVNIEELVMMRLATEEEKEILFKAIKDNGYKWNAETKTLDKLIEPLFKVGNKVRHKNNHGVVFTITSIEEDSYVCGAKAAFWFDDQDDYELVPNKFDTATLKPFESRVLVRDSAVGRWVPVYFGCICDNKDYPYMILGGSKWKYCIPFEGNEHLMDKIDDCDDFYKNWQ